MRIVYVIDSLGASGAEHSTAAMLPVLRELGHEVHVATLYDAGFGDEPRYRADGFDVSPLRAVAPIARVRELRDRLRSLRPDVVHTVLFTSDIVGRLAAWRTGSAVVSSLVNTTYDPARRADPNVRAWKLRVVQAADAATAHLAVDQFHAVTEGVAAHHVRALRWPADRITVVHRGRDRATLGEPSAPRRAEVRASIGVAFDAPVVLAAGRQEFQKGHEFLIDAAATLREQVPGVQVLIAGREGAATPRLHAALARHPELADTVRLLGHRLDVPDLIAAADVVAIPSLYEGTAGVALEAMALDCPVVCSRLDGVEGVLRDGDNALLVSPGDPIALAGALQRVLTDRRVAAQLSAAGRADFEARFTVRAATEAMVAFYERVASRR